MTSTIGTAFRGAGAGAVGTVAMTGVMAASRAIRPRKKQPPRQITARLLGRPTRKVSDGAGDVLTGMAHLGFGATAGAVYAMAARRALGRGRHPVAGALYGLGVWLTSYQGWVPALNILPRASADRPGRPETMALAHLVFGGTVGLLAHEKRDGRRI